MATQLIVYRQVKRPSTVHRLKTQTKKGHQTMIEDKKIENLFQNNQHKLDEMPSPMAWDRLEGRLDERDARRKGFTLRRLAVAAAVFIAVSMLGLWTFVDPLGSGMNKTTALFAEKQLASEIIASDAPAPARPILMSHREKSQYLTEVSKTRINTQPVLAENKSINHNIRPAKTAADPIPQSETVIASKMRVKAEESKLALEAKVMEIERLRDMEIRREKAELDERLTKDRAKATNNPVITTAPTTRSGDLPNTQYHDVEEESDDMMNEEIALEEVVVDKESSDNRADKKRRSLKTQSTGRIASTTTTSENVPTPLAEIAIAENEKTEAEPELDRFDWLLGKWADEDDNSFEEWQRTDANTLEGKGYFVVNVDTTFTQSMKIVQTNRKVYFMINGQVLEGRFELQEYNDRSATFKSKDEEKEQITLKKDKNNSYSVTIEKNKKQTARERKKKKRTFKRVME